MSTITQSNDTNNESREDDLDTARESIQVERGSRSSAGIRQCWNWLVKYKEHCLLSCTLISALVAVVGLFFAVSQFDKSIRVQRHVNAEAAVGQFISQVTELATQETARAEDDQQSNSVLRGFIVSRAQMLIDGEETGQFAGDILRFLAANKFGKLIGREPQTDDGPTLQVRGLVLVDAKLANANVEGGTLSCMGFEKSVFDKVKFDRGSFSLIKLSESKFMSVVFEKTSISKIDFSDSQFVGVNSFKDATLESVRFADLQLLRQALIFEGTSIKNSDFNTIGTEVSLTDELKIYKEMDEQNRLAEYNYLTKLDNASMKDAAIDNELDINSLKKVIESIEIKNIDELEASLAPEKLVKLIQWIELDNLAEQLSAAANFDGTVFSTPLQQALDRHISKNSHKHLFIDYKNFNSTQTSKTWDWVWQEHCPEKQRRDRSLDSVPGDSHGPLLAFF